MSRAPAEELERLQFSGIWNMETQTYLKLEKKKN